MTPDHPLQKRRRQWLVNRPFQFRFVRVMLAILAAMGLSAVAAVDLGVRWTLTSFNLTHDPVIVPLLASIRWTIIVEWLVMAPVVMWVGVRLTHRVAGPLVRIHAALRQLSAGDFNVQLTLRRGDELFELADVINRLAASLCARRPS